MAEFILDSLPSGVVFCDLQGKVLYMNKKYADFLGIQRDDAIGRHIREFLPQSRLLHVMKTGQPELYQRCKCLDRELVVNRIPVRINNQIVGAISHAMFRDFSELKELLDRLDFLQTKVDFLKSNLRSLLSARYTFEDIKGESREIVEAKALAQKYATSDAPVLITGPTGTGKELFAHAIHHFSQRRDAPFVSINCAGIPKDLIESELFGYTKGAFTGAAPTGKAGKIELAHKGTLFLDEIGDLPLSAQGKLLRVLEEKTLERIGDTQKRRIDFRLISATNRDLKILISRGEFREDLYYRVSALTLQLPSLRERVEDIPVLVQHFLVQQGVPEASLTPEALEAMLEYPWPGNVRELKNAVSYAVSVSDSRYLIKEKDLPPEVLQYRKEKDYLLKGDEFTGKPLSLAIAEFEKNLITKTLERNRGNIRKTARDLGISRSTLYYKLQKYDLDTE